jgi:hypothetical protein
MKQWVLTALMAGAMAASPAFGQGVNKPPQEGGQLVQTAPEVPGGEILLGTVRIPRGVTADGKPLPAGSYRIRVTPQVSKPDVVGQTANYERWAEFLQGNDVKGREVVSIVPPSEIARVAEARQPRTGGSRVEMLKGGEYLRVWFNRGGVHYLVHLATGAAEKPAQ